MNYLKRFYLNLKKFQVLSQSLKVKRKKRKIINSIGAKNFNAFVEIAIVIMITSLLGQESSSNILLDLIDKKLFIYILPFSVILRLGVYYFDHLNIETLIINTQASLRKEAAKELFNEENISFAYINYKVGAETTVIVQIYRIFVSLIGTSLQLTVFYFSLLYLNTEIAIGLLFFSLFLAKPILNLLNKFKKNEELNRTYVYEQDRNLERVLNNFYLIKILKKEESELSKLNSNVEKVKNISFTNTKLFFATHNLFNFIVTFIISILLSQTFLQNILNLESIFILIRGAQFFSQITSMYANIVSKGIYVDTYLNGVKNKGFEKNGEFTINSKLNEKKLAISMTNVDFRYKSSEESIFEKLNIDIQLGTHNIITGPNGSGKSTLIGLMTGVYKANSGNILVHSDSFGYVGPVPLIFNESLYGNLVYGNSKQINKEELINLVNEFKIFEKSFDIDSEISINNLSSGQMQKISLIRAIFNKPSVLFLDEATTNLDKDSINVINNLLNDFQGTIVNITHNPNQFEKYNSIFSVDKKTLNKLN
mgnify:FL=1